MRMKFKRQRYGGKKAAARRAAKRRIARRSPIRTAIVSVKRTGYSFNWAFNTASTNGFWRYFTFPVTQMNNFGEFASVFDEYKVRGIKVTFRPRYDTVTADTSATTPQVWGQAHYFVDPSSTTIPAGTCTSGNLNTFLENDGVKSRMLNRPFSIYFRPKAQDSLVGGGTSTRVVTPGYIKTTETGVDMRGFHMFLQPNNFSTANAASIQLDVFYTFYVTFKNLK